MLKQVQMHESRGILDEEPGTWTPSVGTKNRFSKGRLLCPTKSKLATKGEKQESMNCSLRQDVVPGRLSWEAMRRETAVDAMPGEHPGTHGWPH